MNKERILKLADHLDQLEPHEFDLRYFYKSNDGSPAYSCGTPSCIAGHAIELFPEAADRNITTPHSFQAGEVLGIKPSVGSQLFIPFSKEIDGKVLYKVTPQGAAKVLRHLALTEKVDWHVAIDDMPDREEKY